jgi:GNAT superfamily N-acetyltransferase
MALLEPLIERAWRVDMMNLALGHHIFQAEGAIFVVNPSIPSIYDANFVYDGTASSDAEIDRLLDRARREYTHCSKLTFRVAPWSPPLFEARLANLGAEQSRTLVMLLTDGLRGRFPQPLDLRPLEGDEGWRAFRELKQTEVDEHATPSETEPRRREISEGLVAAARLKCPPVRYTLAYVDGRPVGYFNSWSGIDGVGQVENLFVLPSHRHRGIATALIHRCVTEARAAGAGPVVICSNAADTPKAMYAAMGWRPVAVGRQYVLARA